MKLKNLFFATVFAFVICISLPAQGVPSQQNDRTKAKIGNDLAIAKLEQAMRTHPEPLVREKLYSWAPTGRVILLGNDFAPTMNASFEGGQVLLWFNIPYVLQMPDAVNQTDKRDLLWLILYHEAVHIDDHFSGRILLVPMIQARSTPDSLIAQKVWDAEWSAVSKEWVLAKKLKKPYLMPVIDHYTRNGENPKTFLQGFYQLQMSGEAVKLNSSLSAGITSRYKQELAKLLMYR